MRSIPHLPAAADPRLIVGGFSRRRAQYGGATAQEEGIEAARENALAASAVMSVPILA